MAEPRKIDYSAMNMKELKEIAKEKNIEFSLKIKKDSLIEKIEKLEN